MAANPPLVIFTPSGKRGHFAPGTTLLAAARALGVDLDSVCGGRGICGRCQIEVSEGAFAKHGIVSAAANLAGVEATEARYAEKRGLKAGRRLGCQARMFGDLAIDVPPESQLHRQVVRKRAEAHPIVIDPVVRLHYVEVAQPDMHEPSSDLRRLQNALREQWGVAAAMDTALLPSLQKTLRSGDWCVTAAVRHGRDIVALWPGLREKLHGVAIDVGSTTLAAHLCDLATGEVLASSGRMNPQIRFGEDLMSRVSYGMMHDGGAAELTAVLRTGLGELAQEVALAARLTAADIVEVTIVANPIMHHLLLGLDPVELGGAPFALTIDGAHEARAAEVGLNLSPGARAYILPCIAGHVGADAAGMVLAEGPYLQQEIRLLVDVGTNAELVLGNRQRLLACSSPTGPAFEGAQISCGQRAAPGAIERVRINRDTLEPRFKVIGCDLWSDDPGFDHRTPVTGICGSGIIEVIAEMFLAGIISASGVLNGALAARSPRIEPVGRTFAYILHEGEPRLTIYQTDIRAIQLAKSALYAGAKLLMQRYGIDKVDRITLAGAFGTHINPLHALVLGLIPDCAPDKVVSVGNAAGTGARIALLNAGARLEIEAKVLEIEKIETAIEPDFQRNFVAAMAFPHSEDAFAELAKVVELPMQAKREATRRRKRLA